MCFDGEKSKPNFQNIPIRIEEGRRLRKAFYQELFIDVDYAELEKRIMATVTDEDGTIYQVSDDDPVHNAIIRAAGAIVVAKMTGNPKVFDEVAEHLGTAMVENAKQLAFKGEK